MIQLINVFKNSLEISQFHYLLLDFSFKILKIPLTVILVSYDDLYVAQSTFYSFFIWLG